MNDDKQLEQLLSELKYNEELTVAELQRTLMALKNIDDITILNVTIGNCNFKLPLVIADLYVGFVQYIEDSINALEAAD